MKEPLKKICVIVKHKDNSTITITRYTRPTHNSARVFRTPEIVVGYFTDAEIERFRGIQKNTSLGSNRDIKNVWDRYVSHLKHKKKNSER